MNKEETLSYCCQRRCEYFSRESGVKRGDRGGHVNPKSIREGQVEPCDAKFSEKCPCSHNNKETKVPVIVMT